MLHNKIQFPYVRINVQKCPKNDYHFNSKNQICLLRSFTLVKMAICISVLASFLLQMYVIVEIVWTKCRKLLFEEQIENKISQNDYEKESKEDSCQYEEKEVTDNKRWIPLLPQHFKLGTELLVRTLLVTVCC
ncbi:unnamed protein product [Meloidogyne enterolobii]|uniref:Uncharacterized protein n=1 Tax=Meloidogyne enterolobii TaxID=390850 RepID=A0ACB1AWW9_MELEN